MRIIIECNITIDLEILQGKCPIESGSWIYSYIYKLKKKEIDKIVIVCPNPQVKKNHYLLNKLENLQILYFSPLNSKSTKADRYLLCIFERLLDHFKPDIIHIFGTEYPHSYYLFKACENKKLTEKVILNLQGFVGEIANHYYNGIPLKVQKGRTLRDLYLNTSIKKQKEHYEKLAITETKLLKGIKNVIGRTEWDHEVSKKYNNENSYYSCTELIREEIFGNKWKLSNCERHSIFMSQGSYPVKGMHYIIEALPKIIDQFPDTKLYVAGTDILNRCKYRDSYYVRYLRKKIVELNLSNHIIFVGVLNARNMVKQYLNANVFLVCSQIENESNALSEAMICGVPSVCSYVGGMKSRVDNGVNGLTFNSGDIDGLANSIISIFKSEQLSMNLSIHAIESSKIKFNNEKNFERIRNVYLEINERLKEDKK